MPTPRTLTIIGAGRLGKTLGRLCRTAGGLAIGDVLNRSVASAEEAVAFIGAGRAVPDCAVLAPATLFLIATGDRDIEPCCRALAASGRLGPGTIVFHCSGARSSSVLEAARWAGASVAAVHPVKSFADPASAARSFAGTPCGCDGDPAALAVLEPLFRRLGGDPFPIAAPAKTLYHAAAVIASNCLTALVDTSLGLYAQAGIPEARARELIGPLAREALEHALRMPAPEALTGPVARGDCEIVDAHLAALDALGDPVSEQIYRALGRRAVELARARGVADPGSLAAIDAALSNRSSSGRGRGDGPRDA